MQHKITIALDYHPAVLAAMCRHAWDDADRHRCPTGDGLKCPFGLALYCTDVQTEDWEAVCLAQEEEADERT